MATDLSQFSDAELEAMAAQQRTQQAAPMQAPGPPSSSFPPIGITQAPPDPTYNPSASAWDAHPVTGEFARFGSQAVAGLGKFATDLPLMGQQAANVISQYGPINRAIDTALPLPFGIAAKALRAYGGQLNPAELKAAIEEKKQIDEPLASSFGGKVGRFAGGTLAMAALGPSYPAVAAGGAALGMSELTSNPAQLATNAGVGGVTAVAAQGLANRIGGWAARRAEEPLTGWTKTNMNQRYADVIGAKSSAPEDVLAARDAMGAVFDKARSANVIAQIPQGTARTVDDAANELITIDPERFKNLPLIKRVLAVGKAGQATTEDLGALTSELGKKAFASKNPELQDAYYAVEDYLQDRILNAIPDPALKQQYLDTMGRYGFLKRTAGNPSLYNGATGDVNMEAIGRMLQKADTWGYLGGNQTPLYAAARAGQAEGIRPTPPEELTKRVGHAVRYSPATGAIGGLTARGMNLFPTLGPAGLEAGLAGTAISGWNLATAQGKPTEAAERPLPYLMK